MIAEASEMAPILKIRGIAALTNAAMLVVGLMTVSTPAIFPATRIGAATNSAAGASGLFGSRRTRAPYSPSSVSFTSRQSEKSSPIVSRLSESNSTMPFASVM